MLDHVAPSSTPVIADNGANGGAAAVPHARWLRISVTRANRVVVQVCFPSYAVLSLADLVPDDVRVRVVADQVDLESVAADAAARGCPAGELFSVKSGEHGVRAWLD
ncbi:MAG: hypothetical protein ABIT71_26510 [Vicinamibacteraceae bacterium]